MKNYNSYQQLQEHLDFNTIHVQDNISKKFIVILFGNEQIIAILYGSLLQIHQFIIRDLYIKQQHGWIIDLFEDCHIFYMSLSKSIRKKEQDKFPIQCANIASIVFNVSLVGGKLFGEVGWISKVGIIITFCSSDALCLLWSKFIVLG
ncbi:unnamed protein product [Paramecium octaurelia]|uniref:Uncharacterized protein n=1 Tax=Paramecium octaurelia TaxID=43137 RepID=A0A8S1WG59_PAROT|nr:unnamed protein product [Paramecium octaurelia]